MRQSCTGPVHTEGPATSPEVNPQATPSTHFGPVDYSNRTRYRQPSNIYRRVNASLGPWLNELGVTPRDVVMLEVPGRRSAVVRRTLLVRVDVGGHHYLVSLAGESEWVRNVRANGGRAVVGRRRPHAVHLVELPDGERPPILRAYLWRWGRRQRSKAASSEARFYFGVRPDATVNEFATAAPYYPVFRIDYLGEPDTRRGWGK